MACTVAVKAVERMTLHNYLLFLSASLVLVLIPGPDMIYMLSRCIAQGRKAGVMAAIGFNLGGYVHLTAAVLGLSAILAASPMAFSAVRWIGAAYLVYLGIRTLLSKSGPLTLDTNTAYMRTSRTILWQAFLSDVLNPKVAMFFLALLPQFVDPHSAHPSLQIILLGVTSCAVALPINIAIVMAASRVTQSLRQSPRRAQWLQKFMGMIFVALGLRLAAIPQI